MVSLEPVFRHYDACEKSIHESMPNTPYSFINQHLSGANSLFLKWLDVYRDFAQGYAKEPLTRTMYYVIRWLSYSGDSLEKKLIEVFDARIPMEAFILLSDFFERFSDEHIRFVLAEGSDFEQTSIYDELTETLANLSFPRPLASSQKIELTLRDIQLQDIVVLYYERGQFDNVLAWPLLLHESLHSIYDSRNLHRVSENCPAVPWLKEALIDIYVVNFFGPAYAMSLATYLQRYPAEVSVSHPSFSSRILIALRYLTELQKENPLPTPLDGQIADVFGYLKSVWDQHKSVDADNVQESVELIYDSTKEAIRRIISERAKSFVDFLAETEKKRSDAFSYSESEFPTREVASIEDVIEYFESGIPIAANPRILFNAFVSPKYQKMTTSLPLKIFIVESLKKWHIKSAWLKTKQRLSGPQI